MVLMNMDTHLSLHCWHRGANRSATMVLATVGKLMAMYDIYVVSCGAADQAHQGLLYRHE